MATMITRRIPIYIMTDRVNTHNLKILDEKYSDYNHYFVCDKATYNNFLNNSRDIRYLEKMFVYGNGEHFEYGIGWKRMKAVEHAKKKKYEYIVMVDDSTILHNIDIDEAISIMYDNIREEGMTVTGAVKLSEFGARKKDIDQYVKKSIPQKLFMLDIELLKKHNINFDKELTRFGEDLIFFKQLINKGLKVSKDYRIIVNKDNNIGKNRLKVDINNSQDINYMIDKYCSDISERDAIDFFIGDRKELHTEYFILKRSVNNNFFSFPYNTSFSASISYGNKFSSILYNEFDAYKTSDVLTVYHDSQEIYEYPFTFITMCKIGQEDKFRKTELLPYSNIDREGEFKFSVQCPNSFFLKYGGKRKVTESSKVNKYFEGWYMFFIAMFVKKINTSAMHVREFLEYFIYNNDYCNINNYVRYLNGKYKNNPNPFVPNHYNAIQNKLELRCNYVKRCIQK